MEKLLEIITLGLWLSSTVSTRDPIIKPESVSSRADNGQGLIIRAMTKGPCYDLFITYSKTFFRIILIKNTNKNIDFHSEIEELRHKIRVTSFRLTSQIPWRAYVACR